ncbi:hypothetical protein N7470_003818 [Penicillium chermesinum]|nr:hypothetical protein N7470_003818 [Penicillium chermesinum]
MLQQSPHVIALCGSTVQRCEHAGKSSLPIIVCMGNPCGKRDPPGGGGNKSDDKRGKGAGIVRLPYSKRPRGALKVIC